MARVTTGITLCTTLSVAVSYHVTEPIPPALESGSGLPLEPGDPRQIEILAVAIESPCRRTWSVDIKEFLTDDDMESIMISIEEELDNE